jgi:hypothetical protein
MKYSIIIVLFTLVILPSCKTEIEQVSDEKAMQLNIVECLICDIKATPNINPFILLDKYVYDFESIEADSVSLKLYMEEMIHLRNYVVKYPDKEFVLLYGDELDESPFRLWNPKYTRDSICDECAVYYMLSKPTERVSFCTRDNKIFSLICDWDYESDGMVWY